jgi:hypothetical protein
MSYSLAAFHGHSHFGWRSVVLWIVATTACWAVGWDLLIPLTKANVSSWTFIGPYVALGWLAAIRGAFGGALLGLFQVFILDSWLARIAADGKWLRATLMGMVLGWVMATTLGVPIILLLDLPPYEQNPLFVKPGGSPMLIDMIARGVVIGGCVGLILGLCQWQVLRQHVPHASWWIGVSALSWAAGGGVYVSVYSMMSDAAANGLPADQQNTAMLAGWITGGLAVGALTGIVLKLLLNPPSNLSLGQPVDKIGKAP